MAKIKAVFSMIHVTSGLTLSASQTRTPTQPSFDPEIIDVTASPITLDYGSVTSPRQVAFKLVSGNDVKIAFSGSTDYLMRLSGVGDWQLLRINIEDSFQVSTANCGADTGGSLNDKCFVLEDRNGEVKVVLSTDGTTAITSTGRLIIVTIVVDSSNDDIAAAIVGAFAADPDLSASNSGGLVTFTDRHAGVRSVIADVDTGFTFDTEVVGIDPPGIEFVSLGTSQIVVAVAPF